MKAVIVNNDFRVYWKDRLMYLHQFLASKNIDFYAIELFGKGSPYSFDVYNNSQDWWHCLFKNNSADELSKKNISDAVFAELDKINPDIVISSSIVFYAGALSLRWVKKNKKKFIMFDDARHLQVKRNMVVQAVKNLLAGQADGFWFPAKSYYDDYSYFHNKGIHFFYGFDCIDNRLFRNGKQKQFNNKIIICVARLVPIKNINSLLKAWKDVESAGNGYRLAIIGDGPEYDALNSQKLAVQLNTVDFLGAVSHDAIAEYYYNADALVLASLQETWGLVVNEAMAAGLPVLLSHKINAAADLLKEGINGFGFNPVSINEITEALLKYINLDGSAKQSMSANSLKIIDNLSYEKMGIQLYDALVFITNQPVKRPGILAKTLINAWHGRYNTAGWDKI